MSFSSFQTLLSRLIAITENSDDKVMIKIDDTHLTYKDFLSRYRTLTTSLIKQGFKKGDKAAILAPNTIDWYPLFWAISAAGGIPVPLDPQIGEWEFQQLCSQIDFRIVFTVKAFRNMNHLDKVAHWEAQDRPGRKAVIIDDTDTLGTLSSGTLTSEESLNDYRLQSSGVQPPFPGEQPEPNDPLMFACTSGTTGNPKILVVPQEGFGKAEWDMADYLDLSPEDVMLIGMPLYHQGGFGMGLQGAIKGSRMIYQSRFDPVKFLETVEKEKVTTVQLTATLAKILFSVPNFEQYDLSSLRLAYFAGEVLPREIADRCIEQLGMRVINILGSSETATMLIWDSHFHIKSDCNSYATLPFTKVKLVTEDGRSADPGEKAMIHISTDALLSRYYNNPDETAKKLYSDQQGRWFITGDLGQLLDNGRILFAGRQKRVIKRGANLVHAEEIESFLLSHPQICAAAITGKADPLMGESIHGAIQITPNSSVTEKEILAYCRGKLSGYKIPDSLSIHENIPKGIGKIQYKYLFKE